MSEQIDIDANHLSTTEDAFEKFQSVSMLEEDEYVTLSDIVPPQPSVPDLSQELNEIPYDNEVVLGSSQNIELGQVNNHNDTRLQPLDISENNMFERRLDTSGIAYQNDHTPKDLAISNRSSDHQNLYKRKDLSDGLGTQNYVIEDSTSIIQDSLLSTTVGQNDAPLETPSKAEEASINTRRTKRGRIPNIVKYPMTSSLESDTNKTTPAKRRPGRPKKVPLVQPTFEADSTNVDMSLLSENGSVTDGSVVDELTANSVVKGVVRTRRGRSILPLKTVITPTPRKRGRKSTKAIPLLANEEFNNGQASENILVDSTKPEDVDSQMDLDSSFSNSDVSSITLSSTKRKKRGPKKKVIESAHEPPNKNSVLDEDADDICLSKLKKDFETKPNPDAETKLVDNFQDDREAKLVDAFKNDADAQPIDDSESKQDGIISEEITGNNSKRNSKIPIMSDFEYNVDKVVKEATIEDTQTNLPDESECLLVEDTSKRRRTAKKTFVYDEGSDEDPFANLESSDDEPKRRKKGVKYYSDDEYVPSGDDKKRGGRKIRSSSSESEDELDDMGIKKRTPVSGVSPFKKGRKPLGNKSVASTSASKPSNTKSLVSTIVPKAEDDDIEGCLETTMIKIEDSLKPPAEAWATSNEFENFITQKIQGTSLKIKKVSSKEKTDTLAPLDIPVVDQNEPKKKTEASTQTKKVSVSAISVQTSAPYDIPMKTNIDLTAAQSEKACEFLSSVVKTTVELGQLMSQKSDDFMKKKINTEHVTDTFKMDYCVRKSFLLFKLAKHNLLQMEEDLANQYDAFLNENNLSSCRDMPKKITAKARVDSDSDCEIVEVVSASGSAKKKEPKLNPKTVFLNKELSIKIAKKPSTPEKPLPGKKKLEIKGRHAVWINKNVMVKKVTHSQSFLAQDSRNKKPPDTYVTEKMVSEFFEGYNRKKALFTCAPFVNTEWACVQREYACHYFMNELDAASTSRNNDLSAVATENNETPDDNCNFNEINNCENPKTLFSLCTKAILKCIHEKNNQAWATQKLTCNVTDGTDTKEPVTLFRLCMHALKTDHLIIPNQYNTQEKNDTGEMNNALGLHDQNNTERIENIIEELNYWSGQHILQDNEEGDFQVTEESPIQEVVLPLTSICYKRIAKLFSEPESYQEIFPNLIPKNVPVDKGNSIDSYHYIYSEQVSQEDSDMHQSYDEANADIKGPKSLFSLCVELIQSLQGQSNTSVAITETTLHLNACEFKSLKSIAFESIKHILYPSNIRDFSESVTNKDTNNDCDTINDTETNDDFTINCVNTMSEEAFQNLQEPVKIRIRKQSQGSSNFSDSFENNDYGDHNEMDFNADHEADDNGWASQLQVQEFRSCFTPHVNTTENIEGEINEALHAPHELTPRIKNEPVDEFAEENIVDTSIVKTEPLQALHSLNEMTHIPDSIITKKEFIEATNNIGGSPVVQDSSSYNVESFEQFVRSNKMIQSMDESNDDYEIFSQSGLRVRRQHEPDVDPEHDTNMSLLVPHTFEPLHLVEAKGSLMETSSDDESGNSKRTGKKKDKRKKKNKKDSKTINSKETTMVSKETPAAKDKTIPENVVAVLTRRMREKIRQEEKKNQLSDSDSENFYLFSSKKDKSKKDKTGQEEKKVESSGSDSETLYMLSSMKDSKENKESKKENDKINVHKKHLKENKQKDDQVQCNNVDSTEQFGDQFSGFTAIDQNEMTNYQKLMQFVYDKIIPSDTEKNDINISEDNTTEELNDTGPVINPDEPVELLECEPTMPIFDNEPIKPGSKKLKNKIKKTIEIEKVEPQFTERHGWHCYSIDPKDTKIYKDAQIMLEKLPESFVETYMEYQDVMDKDIDDHEVDRLINLQSLNRSISVKDIKDLKSKSRPKGINKEASTSEQNTGNISRSPSPTYSDNFDELVPSDDEGPKAENEIPPPMPVRSSENHLAKNLLMDDHDSDSDGVGGKKIKEEPNYSDSHVQFKKPGPKSRTKVDSVDKADSDSLMLTADKMMNKELNLLHAPIVLQKDADVKESIVKETCAKEESKPSKRSLMKQAKERVKNEDDSSSEEEKQWVSTKEKLLKRMGKKEDAVADDAKRAKLVNEFIERRNESDRKNKRESCQGRKGRARRKLLERQKQLRFLSNELFNKGIDEVTTGKRGAAAGLFKGRRNIRKVIDKKSLARSTVVANMEEFERKRRLNLRQNKLREVLGCEEGVNVLVINDEVCLEYDFVQQRPVVTVHQFFTKVMKAHQYEGVKFMWDACFESLRTIESGHAGGGCILAHCMGLGKTLQVLALLHTVLTHPRANIQRVLVCCPLSTVLNWVDEIHKWIGPVTHEIKVFELSKLRKTYERAYQLEDWYNGGGIFIIGYELFRSLTTLDPEIDEIRPTIINKIRTALLDPGPDIIVCDEGHLLKNDCSVLAVSMSRVVTKRRIVLTGTPMQNNLREYFCMVNFIKPNLLGTYSEYSNRFENPIMNGQHRDSREEDIKLMKARTHILHKVLEGCLQRQEASVLYPYLPKKHEYTVFIPLTQCQWDLYNHYMDNYARTQKQKQILKDFHILQKIWSHPQVLHNFQMKARDKKDKIKAEKIEDDLAIADQEADIKPAETEVWWLQYLGEGAMLDSLDSSNKFVAVFRILHECVALGDKVLIFSTSLFCLDALEFFLKKINKWSLGQEYYRLDGSVPAEVRQKWCREFNADNNIKTKLFLISTRAGCLGLNMTAANRVIILDTSWNPAHDIQSIFRVYRFGQKKDCYIYRLVAMGTMEQKIYERSVTKQAVACRVVDEQQIDRHYNLAELTELYSVDEMGLSVAGGVAVGVGDVALLRVARDAAIHAVHEHDSLLRGSGEQGLPEHERAAAWNQFQQEHEHKQMQNDLNANKAVVALKRLEMEHLRQQALYSAQSYVPPGVPFKTEPTPENYPHLVPKEEPGQKHRGRKHKKAKIVQCRIPISNGPQPGPSTAPADDYENQQDMVRKITNLLIKHNFMQKQSGPKQITELVAKVKRMVATGQPMALGPGYDELSSSIATVLLHKDKEIPMPALTDIEPPMISTPDAESRKRGRPKKSQIAIREPETPAPPIEPPNETDGRRRRKAALAAEMQFDSQKDIIDLDDDGDDWQNNTDDIINDDEPILEPEPLPVQIKEKQPEKPAIKGKTKKVDSSIVLSDDEPASKVIAPAPSAPTPSNSDDTEVIALHPSLLTNSNFIKIVAHTYLAGNPMMDEDAATLAAQYSTFKTLKEAESEGKPIESGAVYDIAIQVLGKEVLKKLQAANPKTSSDSSIATNKLQSLLKGKSAEPGTPPAPTVKKPKIGPKSKLMKDVKQETKNSPQIESSTKVQTKTLQTTPKLVPVSKAALFGPSAATIVNPSSVQHEESILPDEEVIITESPVDKKPVILRRVKLERRSLVKIPPAAAMPVSMGRGPAPQAPPSDATICLDSDEEDAPSPAPPPTRRQRIIRMPTMTPTLQAIAPVPVALTGPNARPLPLPSPAPSGSVTQPTFYKLSPCGTRAIPITSSNPVPISMTGPNGASQPVPVSLLGPGSQTMTFAHDPPVPISFNGPSGSQSFPSYSVSGLAQPGPVTFIEPNGSQAISYSVQGRSQPVPISLTGPGSQPMPISFVGPDSKPMSLSGPCIQLGTLPYGAPASQPIPMSLVDSSGRSLEIASAPMRSQSGLTLRYATHQTQASQQASPMPAGPDPAPNQSQTQKTIVSRPPQNTNAPIQNKTVCKPGDVFRISKMRVVEILNRKLGRTSSGDVVTHTIADDEPAPVPEVPKAKSEVVTTPAPPPSDRSQKDASRRQRRRIPSSSSSSSGRSRSCSPDPLAILKDVVHIQAPDKQSKQTPAQNPPAPQKPAPSQKATSKNLTVKPSNPTTTKTTLKYSVSTGRKTDPKEKGKICDSVDLTDVYVGPGKTSSKKQITGLVGLTNNARPSTSSNAAKDRVDSSKTSGSFKIDTSKHASSKKSSTISKPGPSKLVGTSKNIILDGKSKSLKIDTKNTGYIQMASSKTQVDKRTAPSTSAPAPKKKKTELMTLKDFDIEDIDDIIELD